MLMDSITWYAAVRIDICKWLLLYVVMFKGIELIWDIQLFENNEDLCACT
jgi:hypothetical protein